MKQSLPHIYFDKTFSEFPISFLSLAIENAPASVSLTLTSVFIKVEARR